MKINRKFRRIEVCLAVVLVFMLISVSFADATSWWHSFKPPTDWAESRNGKAIVLSDRSYLHVANVVHTNHGAYAGHGIVTKVSPSGTILWSKGFNRTGDFSTNFWDAVELTNGDILAVGNTWVPLSNGSPCAVLIDAKGNVKWTRIYSKKVPFTWNGYSTGAVENDDGTVTILGLQNLRGGNLPEPLYYGWMSGFAIDIDPASGSVQSSMNIGSVPSIQGIMKTSDGGFAYTTSTFFTAETGYIARLSKFDSTGAFEWSNAYQQVVSGVKYVNELAKVLETETGFMFLSTLGDSMGRFGTTLIQTDKSGNAVASGAYMEPNVPGIDHSSINESFEPTIDGGFILSNRSAFGSVDNIVLKVGSDLHPDWAQQYGNTGSMFYNIVEHSSNAYFAVGRNMATSLGKDATLKLKDLTVVSKAVKIGQALPVKINTIPGSDNSEAPKTFGDFTEEKVQLLASNMGYKTGTLYTSAPPTPVVKPSTFTLKSNPSGVNFNLTKINGAVTQDIILTNTGTKAIKIGTVAISGDNPKDYTISLKNTIMSLSPGKSTKVAVTFKPLKQGARIANLVITSSTASKDKLIIKISGKGQ